MRVQWISEKYMVREDGTVWVLKQKPLYMRRLFGKPPSKTCPYPRITFGRAHEFLLHQIVAAAFHGPCPKGQIVLHWDGDPLNNAASNLRYGTRADNIADTIRQRGDRSRAFGERHYLSKFSAELVASMRRDREAGMKVEDIRQKYGCSLSYASLVTNGLRRRHDAEIEIVNQKRLKRRKPSVIEAIAMGFQ